MYNVSDIKIKESP